MDNREIMVALVIGAYVDEPCRICSRKLTEQDIMDGAVFAGYSPDGKSRAAHKQCFEGAKAVFGEQVVRLETQLVQEHARNQLFSDCLRRAARLYREMHPESDEFPDGATNLAIVMDQLEQARAAHKDLMDYRRRCLLNWQQEKADYYIRTIGEALGLEWEG